MGSKPSEPAGLATRLAAAKRLQSVLEGAPFTPFDSGAIADARDRAFANRLVTVALRRHGHLDRIIAETLAKGVPKRSGLFAPILRIGLTELLFLPDGAAHSALYLAGEALRRDRRGAHLGKLLNGVLRRVQREAETFTALPAAQLFPDWLAARWRKTYGPEALTRFADALLVGAPLDLTLRQNDPGLIAALKAHPVMGTSVRVAERDQAVADLPGYAEGRWWVQDAAAALPARLIDLPPGARVLDMCAAPGGKTAQLAAAGYRVTALDMDAARLERVAANLQRLGLEAELVEANGAAYRPDTPFDAVLLDAPCSATGTFRRHPEVVRHRTRADIAARAELQRDLLLNATNCLNQGGMLVYATCSLEPEEGEQQADWLGATVRGIEPVPVASAEIGGLETALDGAGRVRLHPGLTAPGDLGGAMDGFFVARFRTGRVEL